MATSLFPQSLRTPGRYVPSARPPTESVTTTLQPLPIQSPTLPMRSSVTTLRPLAAAPVPVGPPMPVPSRAGLSPSGAAMQLPAPPLAAPKPSSVIPGTIWLRPAIRRPAPPQARVAAGTGRQLGLVPTVLQREDPRVGNPLRQQLLYSRAGSTRK